MNRFCFLLLLSIVILPAIAQKGLGIQYEPTFSYTKEISNRWSSNLKIASRNTFFASSGEGTTTDYEMNFLEAQLFVTYALWNDIEIGGGYTLRGTDLLESPGMEYRPMQQIAYVTYSGFSRLAHRFRTEQRFREDGYENRWRYRLSYDKPLRGQRLDLGEPYIVLSDEVLYTFNAAESSVENRISLTIGWLLPDGNEFETGIQYRLGAIGQDDPEHIIWLTTTYYLTR